MVIVGERINGTSKRVQEAIVGRDAEFIVELAARQADAGADYLDVNAGTTPDRDSEDMTWLVKTVQGAVEKPLCIDSPNPAALRAGLEAHQGQALVNSASAEAAKLGPVMGLAQEFGARLVALTLADEALPKTAEERVEISERLADAAVSAGIALDDLFIDPLVRAVAVEAEQGMAFLDSVSGIKQVLPEVHVICGLSNISFQMPARGVLNSTFLAMAMARGMDAAILDPFDQRLMATLCAAQVLLGRDDMCLGYITAYREGKLDR